MVEVAIGTAILIALLIADVLFYRLVTRAIVGLIELMPPYRPRGRYRSQSSPEQYALLRKSRKGS